MNPTRRNHAIEPVWLDYFDPHNLLVGATRYYLSGRSICACGFARELAAAWNDIPKHTQAALKRDIENELYHDSIVRKHAEKIGPLGHNFEREEWEKVRQAWEAMQ